MSDKIAFCSFAFGHGYYDTQQRLKESILKIYPDAPLFFYSDSRRNQVGDNSLGDEPGAAERASWDRSFKHTGPPPGARPFHQSMYGFKPYLIQAALDAGHKKVVFFDPSIILLQPLTCFETLVKDYGVLAFEDCGLTGAISNQCLAHFGLSRDWASDKILVAGSFYFFDFNLDLCQKIFSQWKASEQAGAFGSQSEASEGLIPGHRSDEAALSCCLYKNGSKPLSYQTEFSSVIVKKHHFKC
jgi:hypothetical protein